MKLLPVVLMAAAAIGAGIEYFELPVAFDALTVVVNPKNTFVQQLTVAELKTHVGAGGTWR